MFVLKLKLGDVRSNGLKATQRLCTFSTAIFIVYHFKYAIITYKLCTQQDFWY